MSITKAKLHIFNSITDNKAMNLGSFFIFNNNVLNAYRGSLHSTVSSSTVWLLNQKNCVICRYIPGLKMCVRRGPSVYIQ